MKKTAITLAVLLGTLGVAGSTFALDAIVQGLSYTNLWAQPQTYPIVDIATTRNGVHGDNIDEIVVYGEDVSSSGQTYVRVCAREYINNGLSCGAWTASGHTWTGYYDLRPAIPSQLNQFDSLYLNFYASGSSSSQRPRVIHVWDY